MAELIDGGIRRARRLGARARGLAHRAEQRHERRRARGPEIAAASLDWFVDELVYFRGHGYVTGSVAAADGRAPVRVQLLAPGGALLGAQPLAPGPDGRSPFALDVAVADPVRVRDASLRFVFDDGAFAVATGLIHPKIALDPYHRLTDRFWAECRALGTRNSEAQVLEIGSRARSGNVRRDLVAPMRYVGIDILEGENTDIVGDAHALSRFVDPLSFDALFSISTFEHLAMPWKVVLEINRVLKPGGLVLISSHQAFPLHEQPWDFWRFSDMAWHALFNEQTGFQVIETALGERANVVADLLHAVTTTLELQPAFIGSIVLAEKIRDTDLSWPVDVGQLTETMYPQ